MLLHLNEFVLFGAHTELLGVVDGVGTVARGDAFQQGFIVVVLVALHAVNQLQAGLVESHGVERGDRLTRRGEDSNGVVATAKQSHSTLYGG